MNSVLNMLSGGNVGNAILLQAVGAALRGESPQAFMKRLANNHPQLKKMNLDDLYGTAEKLCQEKGLNMEDVQKNIDDAISSQLNK